MQFITVALVLAATGALAAPSLHPRVDQWTIEDLTRGMLLSITLDMLTCLVCATNGTSCTYNFNIDLDDGSTPTACSITNTVADAPEASWYALPCNPFAGFFEVSWGYSATGTPPFAIITVVNTDTETEAFFGIDNPNDATDFGDIGPSLVQST